MNTRLQAGKIRKRVQILQPNDVQDSTGGTSLANYTVLATVWASVEAVSGREQSAGQSMTSLVTHNITIRYMDGINASQQVLFGTRKFQIEAVMNPDELTKKLVLQVIEINDGNTQ